MNIFLYSSPTPKNNQSLGKKEEGTECRKPLKRSQEISLPHFPIRERREMCFNLGYKPKKRKHVGKKGRSVNGEEESKGLLLKEVDKWKQQQEETLNQDDHSSSLHRPSTPNH